MINLIILWFMLKVLLSVNVVPDNTINNWYAEAAVIEHIDLDD